VFIISLLGFINCKSYLFYKVFYQNHYGYFSNEYNDNICMECVFAFVSWKRTKEGNKRRLWMVIFMASFNEAASNNDRNNIRHTHYMPGSVGMWSNVRTLIVRKTSVQYKIIKILHCTDKMLLLYFIYL
jgi:hypothetical protein